MGLSNEISIRGHSGDRKSPHRVTHEFTVSGGHMKKTLATIALAGSIALIGAFPAVAADKYPAPPANAAVSDGVVGPGADFVFRGKGFKAGEGLVIKVTPGTKPA